MVGESAFESEPELNITPTYERVEESEGGRLGSDVIFKGGL